MSHGAAIIARGLVVTHRASAGPVRALRGLDLDVDAGSSAAVMGPSGCGKSTLLGILAGLAVPDEGSVTIGPDTITGMSEKDRGRFRRRRLGMVYQTDNLLPHLTVEENVALQLAISGASSDDRDHAAPHEILGRLDLAGLGDRLPDQLSGGQRQRVAVARAIVHRPALILADEPTGSLDESNAELVIGLLIDAQRELGATLVMVTHDPAMAVRTDRVVHLEPPPWTPSEAGRDRSCALDTSSPT